MAFNFWNAHFEVNEILVMAAPIVVTTFTMSKKGKMQPAPIESTRSSLCIIFFFKVFFFFRLPLDICEMGSSLTNKNENRSDVSFLLFLSYPSIEIEQTMGWRKKNSPARRSTFTNEMFVFHFNKNCSVSSCCSSSSFFDISIDKRDATTFTFAHPKTKETRLLWNSRDQVKIYVSFKKKDKWIERLTWLLSTSMIIGSAFYDDGRSFSLVFFSPFFQPQTNNALLLQSNANHDGVDGGRRDAMASKHNLWWTTFFLFSFSKQSLTVSTEMAAANAQPFFVFHRFYI